MTLCLSHSIYYITSEGKRASLNNQRSISSRFIVCREDIQSPAVSAHGKSAWLYSTQRSELHRCEESCLLYESRDTFHWHPGQWHCLRVRVEISTFILTHRFAVKGVAFLDKSPLRVFLSPSTLISWYTLKEIQSFPHKLLLSNLLCN